NRATAFERRWAYRSPSGQQRALARGRRIRCPQRDVGQILREERLIVQRFELRLARTARAAIPQDRAVVLLTSMPVGVRYAPPISASRSAATAGEQKIGGGKR